MSLSPRGSAGVLRISGGSFRSPPARQRSATNDSAQQVTCAVDNKEVNRNIRSVNSQTADQRRGAALPSTSFSMPPD
jgi:hypothetical protein